MGTYEFGANVVSEKFMMLGRIATDGRLSGRLKYDVLDWLGVKLHMQLSNEAGQSQVMVDSDVKGRDWNAQLKLGSPSFLGLNYFQVISRFKTPCISKRSLISCPVHLPSLPMLFCFHPLMCIMPAL